MGISVDLKPGISLQTYL